ncbi:MAG: porin [Candidatus Eremiobacteraeota bacterium]|nr:porin [Candidatus Eremiobacteraeota bacterium]
MLYVIALAAALAASDGASPAPSASPLPTPSLSAAPTPAYSLDGAFTEYSVHSTNANATGALDNANGADLQNRTDVSNAVLTFSKNTGSFRFSVTGGAYALPVVGQAINPTTQQSSNAWLYGFFPAAYLAYVPNAHLTVTAGKQTSLLGQENAFTFQNLNVTRGIAWATEPTISRGVRAAYVQGKFSGILEYNDGYYSGNNGRALEGLVGFAPSSTTDVQVAFMLPGPDTPGNVTSGVANKREYDLMFTKQYGKLQLLPYLLFVDSPSSARLGYVRPESALAIAFLANYTFDARYSVAARYESFADHSASGDASPNADLLGFGSGSRATTWTVTPGYRSGNVFARAEYSANRLANFAPGLGFGSGGLLGNQSRVLVEFGAVF